MNSEPFFLHDAWYAIFDGRLSPEFNCRGAAAIWLQMCRRDGRYRS